MDKVKRFQPLLMLAKQSEEKASVLFQSAKFKHEHAEKRLAQMESYHAEYQLILHNSGFQGISSVHLQQMYQFIIQLKNLVAQQKVNLENAGYALENAKLQWHEKHVKRKMFEKLIENYQKEIDLHKEKIERREQDDLSSRVFTIKAQKGNLD